MNNRAKIVIGIVAFALLLVFASAGYRWLSNRAVPQNDTAASPSQTEKTVAPDFTVQDADGNTVSLSDYIGKPVILNFWASWCPPCKGEMPDFEEMYKKYSDQDVVFMMVNMTDGERETTEIAKAFLQENGYTFPAYFDVDQSAAYAYGISSIPDSIFIDKEGNVFSAYKGMIDAKTLEKNIEEIMK